MLKTTNTKRGFFLSNSLLMIFLSGSDRDFIYEPTPGIRIQQLTKAPMAGPMIEVVEARGPFEKIIGHLPFDYAVKDKYYNISQVQIISLARDSAGNLIANLSFPGGQAQEKIE